MRLSVIEGSQETLVDLINPDRPEIFAVEDPLLGPMVRKIWQIMILKLKRATSKTKH